MVSYKLFVGLTSLVKNFSSQNYQFINISVYELKILYFLPDIYNNML
jgi:hypothetical protein